LKIKADNYLPNAEIGSEKIVGDFIVKSVDIPENIVASLQEGNEKKPYFVRNIQIVKVQHQNFESFFCF
jgi:hypothetical protein